MIEIGGSDWFIQVVQITYDVEQGILLLDVSSMVFVRVPI
jgi:hypothetical protein